MSPTTLAPASDKVLRTPRRMLDHYAKHSAFSMPGRHAALLNALPSDPAGIARAIQGLVIYEHVAEFFYGCQLANARRAESHVRPVEKMIDALMTLDARPLTVARPPERRLVGVCRHYMLLAVAAFRQHGVPARGRVGFGAYLEPGKLVDHWVCEHWKANEERWALLDAQLDDVFIRNLSIGLDLHDVPREQFLTSSVAWHRCRSGELDPEAFGIRELRGLWFVAASLVRDLATLNGCEVLAWDVWGAMPPPDAQLSPDQLAFFDGIAHLTANPDASFDALKRRFAEDGEVRLPRTVFNPLRQRQEEVVAD